jgi:hypothetical protein
MLSCGMKMKTFNALSETKRMELMREEIRVSGDFLQLRPFHTQMRDVLKNPEAHPTPTLDSLFAQMNVTANAAILPRLQYDTLCREIRACNGSKKYLTAKTKPLLAKWNTWNQTFPTEQKKQSSAYFRARLMYQDTCFKYGIHRLTPQQFAEVLSEKINQWQDSLEESGRMSAKCQNDLYQRFPERKGKTFFEAYQPISELQLAMKGLESLVSQLQNSASRFEESNKEDFFYFGSVIRSRMEVAVTEDLLAQLSLQMRVCREQQQRYTQQFVKE